MRKNNFYREIISVRALLLYWKKKKNIDQANENKNYEVWHCELRSIKNNHGWNYIFYSLIILLESALLLSSSPLKNGISLKKSTQIIAATAFSTEEIELRVDEHIIK